MGTRRKILQPLSEKQEQYFDFIWAFFRTLGVMPSTREIQHQFEDASQSSAVHAIKYIVKKGWMIRIRINNKRTCLAITKEAFKWMQNQEENLSPLSDFDRTKYEIIKQ